MKLGRRPAVERVSALAASMLFVSAQLASSGCGGKVIFDDGAGGTSAGPAGGTGTHSTTATGGSADLRPKITSAQFFGNCKPEVPSDPLGGSFVVKYKNKGSSAASIDVTSAQLHLLGAGQSLQYDFAVDPTSSGSIAASQAGERTHQKTQGSGHFSPPGPMLCSTCGSQATLHVTWSNGASDDFGVTLGCGL